jgi:hypothetical protein
MTKHTFRDFDKLADWLEDKSVATWSEMESRFIKAVEKFDSEFAAGKQTTGWYKAKARYFNDFVIQLLQNWTELEVAGPVHRDSQLFHKIDIDICYPAEGVPTVGAEVKALGTPGHKGNGWKPRAARSDLHKRVREVAFTSTDLKAAYARPTTIKTFQSWVERVDPAYFSFWAVRVEDARDFETVRSILVGLRNYCNGVGAVIYEPVSKSAKTIRYKVKTVPELSMDKALRRMAQHMA